MKHLFLLLLISIILFCCGKESKKKEISEISEPVGLTVDYGNSPDIPTRVEIKYNDGSSKFLFITWDSIVNPTIPGDHKLKGAIIPDPDIPEIKERTFNINVHVNNKSATCASDKWPKDYLYESFTSEGQWQGKAINVDSMNYYEKDINSFDYFYRVVTDNETSKYIHDYVYKNYNWDVGKTTIDSNEIAVLFMYTYRYKTILADTLKPVVFNQVANEYVQNNQFQIFKGIYGDKYSTEGTLILAYGAYYILQPAINQKSISEVQIIDLYKQLDLKTSNISIMKANNFLTKYYQSFSLGRLLTDYGCNLLNETPMQQLYNNIKARIDSAVLNNSLSKNDNLYFVRTQFKRYAF